MSRSQFHRIREQKINSSGNRAPTQVTLPTRSGTPTVGQVQTGTNGTFAGDGTITITREWYRSGVRISGQTGATYTTVAADQGKRLSFVNRARSQYGELMTSSTPVLIT